MTFLNILMFIGGLSMLLFGIQSLSACLCRFADGRLSHVVEEMTSSYSKGVLWGMGITSLIQSSAVMTVTVVGLTNAGMLRLRQAIAVIMGANIGTTLTAWILSVTGIVGESAAIQLFRPATLAAVFAVVGVILMSFIRNERGKALSSAFLSVAILFFGMMTMTEIALDLMENGFLTDLFRNGINPIFCMLIGIAITALLQSSSASIGILQAVSATGIVPVSLAVPMVLGMEIGACTAALISSVGSSVDAKRAAFSHLLFNIFGAVAFLFIFMIVGFIFDPAIYAMPISLVGIAVVHSLFNILTMVSLIPFIGRIEKLLCRIISEKTPSFSDAVILEQRFLFSPAFAAKHSYNAVLEMVSLVYESIIDAIQLLRSYDREICYHLSETKSLVDEYENKLRRYLTSLGRKELSREDGDSLSSMLCSVVILKQLGRVASDLGNVGSRIHEYRHEENLLSTLEPLFEPLREILRMTFSGFEHSGFDVSLLGDKCDTFRELCENAKNKCCNGFREDKFDAEVVMLLTSVIDDLRYISECCDELSSYISRSDVGLLEKRQEG